MAETEKTAFRVHTTTGTEIIVAATTDDVRKIMKRRDPNVMIRKIKRVKDGK